MVFIAPDAGKTRHTEPTAPRLFRALLGRIGIKRVHHQSKAGSSGSRTFPRSCDVAAGLYNRANGGDLPR